MSNILLILLTLVLAFALLTILHVRIRLTIQSERKTLIVGLGRTGVLTDFTDNTRSFIFAGKTLKTSPIEEKPLKPIKAKPLKKSKRTRPLKDILAIIPNSFGASRKYIFSIIKSVVIEEFEVEVKAALPEPHLTGMAFGFYQAGVAAFPGIGKKFKFIPDWSSEPVTGSLKTTASIPLYKIIYRTTVLVFSLPLRKLVKLAIGRKDRKQNGRAK